jgi:hypothetical protein
LRYGHTSAGRRSLDPSGRIVGVQSGVVGRLGRSVSSCGGSCIGPCLRGCRIAPKRKIHHVAHRKSLDALGDIGRDGGRRLGLLRGCFPGWRPLDVGRWSRRRGTPAGPGQRRSAAGQEQDDGRNAGDTTANQTGHRQGAISLTRRGELFGNTHLQDSVLPERTE